MYLERIIDCIISVSLTISIKKDKFSSILREKEEK